jgi:hypothetical protein
MYRLTGAEIDAKMFVTNAERDYSTSCTISKPAHRRGQRDPQPLGAAGVQHVGSRNRPGEDHGKDAQIQLAWIPTG